MYGLDILCGISKGTIEIPHKISKHMLKDTIFMQHWILRGLRFKTSYMSELICVKSICSLICANYGVFQILMLFNSSPPSAAYMRQWIRSALVQIMACRLFGAKPLSKLMLGYRQFDP